VADFRLLRQQHNVKEFIFREEKSSGTGVVHITVERLPENLWRVLAAQNSIANQVLLQQYGTFERFLFAVLCGT
jgi:hypothetical protein